MLIEDCGVVGRCENGIVATSAPSMVAPGKHIGNGGGNGGTAASGGSREERMARYKEERRRQLAAQFGPRDMNTSSTASPANIRSTRASRLRTQANSESYKINKEPLKEEENYNGDTSTLKKGKDKSHKRKSNLNKAPSLEMNSPQSYGESGRRKTMVSPKLSRICSPKTKKSSNATTTSPSVNTSPVPRSSQLVQRHVNRTAQERGAAPDSPLSSSPVNRQISRVRAVDKIEPSSTPSVPLAEMPSPANRDVSTVTPNRDVSTTVTPNRDVSTTVTPIRLSSLLMSKSNPCSPAKHPSILKKSSLDEPIPNQPPTPVSILKRKTSQEEANTRCISPVRFSSDVVEKKSNRGILKKHRSLDDPQIALLNASSDNSTTANQETSTTMEDTRSILKPSPSTTPPPHQPLPPQRRCSLEEVVRRTLSPEPQGILKRKASREEVDQQHHHLHHHDTPPPHPPQGILKKKSFSCDESASELLDSPRPILKKKSSSEEEEHHVKPILKSAARKSIEEEVGGVSGNLMKRSSEENIRPILKHTNSPPAAAAARDEVVMRVKRNPPLSAQSNRVVSIDLGDLLQRQAAAASGEQPGNSTTPMKPRPMSIAERISDLANVFGKSSSRMDEPNGKLERSSGSSVLETASIFNQLEQREKAAADAGKTRRAVRGIRNRNKHEGGTTGRYSTQPVTSCEVEQAKRNNDPDCDEADPSKLSLAERVALFSRRSTAAAAGTTQSSSLSAPSSQVGRRTRHSTGPTISCSSSSHQIELPEVTAKPSSPQLQQQQQMNVVTPPPTKRIISKSMSGVLVEGLMKNLAHKSGAPPTKLKLRSTEDAPGNDHGIQSCDSDADEDDEEEEGDVTTSSSESDDGGGVTASKEVIDSARENKENREVVIRRRSAMRKQRITPTRGGLFPNVKGKKEVLEETSSEETSSGGKEVSDILHKKFNGVTKSGGVKKSSSEVLEMLAGNGNGGVGEVSVALRRCATQHIHTQQQVVRDEVDDLPKLSIAERLAALKEHAMAGRIISSKPPPVGGVSRVSERLGQLETASQTWRSRVEVTDEVQFTVAGKMGHLGIQLLPPLPQPNLYKSDGIMSASTPSVPNSLAALMKRSLSVTEGEELENGENNPSIQVPAPYDDGFSAFFTKAENLLSPTESTDIFEDIDFEEIASQSNQLLVQRRNVRVQRKHRSANPVKALAARNDLKSEYIEVKTGVADREIRRINIEKLSKSSGFAMEALAGLASKEDLSAVSLKKADEALPSNRQWPRPLLIRLKGRRHGVTSLVACHYSSVNQGDSYILVTDNQVFHWIGEFSNIIEKSRGNEVAQAIQSKKDLGCTGATEVFTLEGGSFSEKHRQFWRILSLPEDLMHSYKGEQAGPPNEDEIYEIAIAETFAVYAVENELLQPVKEYWGRTPKIELLDPNKVLVFDFGTEVYMWSGKHADMKERRHGNRLAQEVFKKGYRSDSWRATGIAWLDRQLKNKERPSFSVYCKTTQHMEPVLFKEKFLNWPDFGRVIRVSSPTAFNNNNNTNNNINNKENSGSIEARPCDVDSMLNWKLPDYDLVIEGTHLGRGKSYFDNERRLLHEVTTEELAIWQIRDYTKTSIDPSSYGIFQDGECYIVYWKYVVSVTGREMSGAPSRHGVTGRERILYTTWQGDRAPVLDQGAAALLAVDHSGSNGHNISSAQALLFQGQENPVFISMLPGPCVIVNSTRQESNEDEAVRMFLCTGDCDDEGYIEEVLPRVESLRSNASVWMLNTESGKSYLWHGHTALHKNREVALKSVSYLVDIVPKEFEPSYSNKLSVEEIKEGEEPEDFLGGEDSIRRDVYNSTLLLKNISISEETIDTRWPLRMYHLSSITGEFTATPVIPYRYSSLPTVFPYRQNQLYDVSQPGLMIIDSGDKLWLWCGWWESGCTTDSRGSAWCRHLAERRAAMTSCLDYWTKRRCTSEMNSAYVVWAGLEPVQFSSLFPIWETTSEKYKNAQQFNIEDGHYEGEMRLIEDELAKERKTFPVYELTTHPLPAGVDPTRLELYLQIKDFNELLGMTKEEFQELPSWKRTNLKKKVGLF